MPTTPPDDSLSPAEALFAEWLVAKDAGGSSHVEALYRVHPAEAAELRVLWAYWQGLKAVLERVGFSASPASLAEKIQEMYGTGVDPAVSLEAGEEGQPPSSALLRRLAEHSFTSSRYKLQGELARGGMGAILQIWDEDLRRTLAMKVSLGLPDAIVAGSLPATERRHLARFLEEAQITGQLDHPGIVPVHELGLDAEGRVFFTMKLVKGRDLKRIFDLVFAEEEGWNETRALGVVLKVCEAMAYAHAKGVIHRDLKPANVMVGGFGEVYVMDWGLARVLGRKDSHDLRLREDGLQLSSIQTERKEERQEAPDSPIFTMDGEIVGTPVYMPPEQARGEVERVGPHADVYSIGAMLYHLLARQMPYVGPGVRISKRMVLFALLQGPPVALTSLRQDTPAELVAIVEKAMARAPEQRYGDMLALFEDLRAFLEHRVVKAYQTGARAELRKWVERNKALASSAAAAVLLLVVGLTTSLIFKAQSDHNAKLAEDNAAKARDNEQRAIQGETLAKNETQRADSEAETAKKNEKIATARAADVLRLSALQRLEDLTSEADALWPASPENVPKYAAWLKRAQALVEELPLHEQKLADLRAKAQPWTAEMQAQQRASHPRLKELASIQRHLVYLHELAAPEPSKEASAEALGIDWNALPKDANGLNALAWPLVDPERKDWGGEAKGLAFARRAVERASSLSAPERAALRDTLAWALFANALFDDAVGQGEQAIDEAGAERKREFEAKIEELKKAIDERISPEGLEVEAQLLAELETQASKLEAEVSQRPEWFFADAEDKWWHNQLEKLVNGIHAFADEKTGLFSNGTSEEHGWGMKKRLEFASSIEEQSVTSTAAAQRWSAAIASIANKAECPQYGGLRISAQLGLLPIGRDPDSGLWEFVHVQTGEPAARGPDGKLVLKEETGLVFVLLPGGTFTMGAQASVPSALNYDRSASRDEGPVQAVTLSPFFLSKYEMTQGQWACFSGHNPSVYGPDRYDPRWNHSGKGWTALHPVEQVSWSACVETLARMSLTLPSEAQWEYGCRGGTSSRFWSGDRQESLQSVANLSDAYGKSHGNESWVSWESWLDDGQTVHAEVGSYRPNAFGLYDVHGNVCEWCLDGLERIYEHGTMKDPVAAFEDAPSRIHRGSSFDLPALYARSANRNNGNPDNAGANLGLRPAMGITTRDFTTSPPSGR